MSVAELIISAVSALIRTIHTIVDKAIASTALTEEQKKAVLDALDNDLQATAAKVKAVQFKSV
jgi:hypothetical protein